MKLAFRIVRFNLSKPPCQNPNFIAPTLQSLPLSLPLPLLTSNIQNQALHSFTFTLCSSMSSAGNSQASNPNLSSPSLEKQFHDFRSQLEESGNLREKIRLVVMEIESTNRLISVSLLLVHQSRPIQDVLKEAKSHVGVLKEHYHKLAETLRECSGQYYRYHGDWRSETQSVVSLLAFIHWLESGNLLLHSKAEETLGLNNLEYGLDIEDYLIGICFMSNEMPRYVVNQVTAGNYDCPRRVLDFMTDLHASFRMLNLRNDFLRKKFDSMKYDLRRVEEVFYDVKIRGLVAAGAEDKTTGE